MSATQQDTATHLHERNYETPVYQGYETLLSCLYSAANVSARWQVLELKCQISYYTPNEKQ